MAYDPGPLPTEPQTPEEEVEYHDRLRQVLEEKRKALHEPGPAWREWFLYSAMKYYLGLAFLIADAWVVVTFLQFGEFSLGLVALFGALYLEFLCYQVLWYRPPPDRPVRLHFQRNWHTPVPFGRWTPEAELARAGAFANEGPSPREFL